MHNSDDYDDQLSAEKQNAVEFKYESQDLIPMNEMPTLSGHISVSSNNNNLGLEQSLTDLKVITNGNKNLSISQRNFFVSEIGKV